jgi:hypothetical protein
VQMLWLSQCTLPECAPQTRVYVLHTGRVDTPALSVPHKQLRDCMPVLDALCRLWPKVLIVALEHFCMLQPQWASAITTGVLKVLDPSAAAVSLSFVTHCGHGDASRFQPQGRRCRGRKT